MRKILTFNGSPRPSGNSSTLLQQFIEGARENTNDITEISPQELDLEYCHGCLRCNILKRCSISGDSWNETAEKILEADVLVFASPIYFHHLTAPMKKVMDRFRSFIHVEMTETGLIHTPWQEWKKDFVLILSMGSSDQKDAEPVVELFNFITTILGPANKLHILTATRLAVVNQVIKTEEELRILYPKLTLPEELAKKDALKNRRLLEECRKLGKVLSKKNDKIQNKMKKK